MDLGWVVNRIAETEQLLRDGERRLQLQRDYLAVIRQTADPLVIDTTEKIIAVLGEIQAQRVSELDHLRDRLQDHAGSPKDADPSVSRSKNEVLIQIGLGTETSAPRATVPGWRLRP